MKRLVDGLHTMATICHIRMLLPKKNPPHSLEQHGYHAGLPGGSSCHLMILLLLVLVLATAVAGDPSATVLPTSSPIVSPTTTAGSSPSSSPRPALVGVAADHAVQMSRGLELYRSRIRGILQSKCIKCHSGNRLEGELDLSNRAGLLRGGHHGPAVVPGDHRKSLLWQLVAHEKEPFMPYERPKLSDSDIANLAEWIDRGAPYDRPFTEESDAWIHTLVPPEAKKHWAFQPLPRDIPVPTSARNPIDAFIGARLQAASITPNPPTDRRTLLRRLYLDIIGLPPTPEQWQAFVQDTSPQAVEKVVEELLSSPHFGEKWARHWLDLVRFAESHGFEHDYDRPHAYHYRDFVIKALNQDMPYDQFVRWQIAGDELAPNEPLAWFATGYLAAGVHSTQITKNEVEKHRYDELDDIVNNIGTTFLGLSIGCARCHDHKYDPIPSRDYYRMLSAFTTTVRSDLDIDLDAEGYRKALAEFEARHRPYREKRLLYERERLPEQLARWEADRTRSALSQFSWYVPHLRSMKSAGGATLQEQSDGSIRVTGKNPDQETLTIEVETHLPEIRGIRIEALRDSQSVRGGPGRASNGNFALSDVTVHVVPRTAGAKEQKVSLVRPRASFEQNGFPAAATIDADPKSAWAIDPRFGEDHALALDLEPPLPGSSQGLTLRITLSFQNNTGHGMSRPRLALTSQASADLQGSWISEAAASALSVPASQRTASQRDALLRWFATRDEQYQRLIRAEEEHAAKAPKRQTVKALICSEGVPPLRLHSQGEDYLPVTHFLRRGDPNQKVAVARLSFLQVLMPHAEAQERWFVPPPPGSRTTGQRAALARWLTDAEQGAGALLARVIVNRLWQQYFGKGLVRTVSDFGLRGEPPTHPELLDFLARELIRHNWRLKPIHKLIVTSEAYARSCQRSPEKLQKDPENRLLWCQPVRRLSAEVIRDSILAVSGLLDRTMYGPGTLQPDSRRRSIYFTVKRSKLIPALIVFDAPDATVHVGERPSTTIAPQALHLLNNPQVRAASQALAQRILQNSSLTDTQAVQQAYRIVLCREPSSEELQAALEFLSSDTTRQQRKAFTDFCQMLFCLNEFLYWE